MSEQLHHGFAYFSETYQDDEDPWGFDQRWYERRKYAMTLAALPHPRYRRALEPGCANGALTELLAPRCDQLIAFDFVPDVVTRARDRLAIHPHVSIEEAEFPEWLPPGTGDLLVWSEVGYYLTDTGLERGLDTVGRWLEPGGTMIAIHYTGATNYPRTGEATHEALESLPSLHRVSATCDHEFRIDVWRRLPR